MLGGGNREIKQKGSAQIDTDDSLSSSENGYDSRGRLIPNKSSPKRNNRSGTGRRRRRDAGSMSRHSGDDYDLETGSRGSNMLTV